ncbi:glycosyltransferase family 4 protein [Salinibacillus aidingensis]|uniref:Glycosyltransferase family 4 protein n=1 Tax=Salinibacillus aidingensis TaxID=237684 RepID=A0ABN1B4Z1_9BACI
MGKQICFLVTEHPFLDARIFKKEAKSLVKQGYSVTMIVPRRKGHLFDVDGTFFTNRFQSRTFVYEGIKIITYEQIDFEKKTKQLLHNLLTGTHHRFTDSLTQIGIEVEADIYHAHEFFSLYSGIGIKRALASRGKACRLIYDSHELEPDPLIMESKKIKKVKRQMLEAMFNELDQVITVSESIKAWYHSIQPSLPIEVVYNSPPLAPEYDRNKETADLVIAFEGILGSKRGSFQKLLRVLELANEKISVTAKIIGGWKEQDQKPSIPPHLKSKVLFKGWLDYEAIPMVIQGDADIGWVDLDASHSLNNRYAMPNKFFSYLNNGLPVLVNQCEDMNRFIERYQCGYIIDKPQANAEDYAQALQQIYFNKAQLKEMSLNARKIMETAYSWEHMEERLFSIYARFVQDDKSQRKMKKDKGEDG